MQQQAQNGWYLARGGETYGPYSWDEIAEHAAGRRIGAGDKILDPRTGAWAKAAKVPGLFGSGGVAAAPVGLSAAMKAVLGVALMVTLLGVGVTTMWVASGTPGFDKQVDTATAVQGIVDSAPERSDTAELPPEGLVYKGTFNWSSVEGVGLKDLKGSDAFYLWIYTTDDGTAASFNYGEHMIDGWPVYLVSKSGSTYVFESSENSLVERVKIRARVSGSGVNGEITKINNVAAFIGGSFSGDPATYDEYKAEVID